MPGSLPAIPGVKVVRALERAGFTVVRISGSHRVMRLPMAGRSWSRSTRAATSLRVATRVIRREDEPQAHDR